MFTFFLLTVICWMIAIFIALPIGVKIPDSVEKGHASSAPSNPYLGLKLILSLLIAMVMAWVLQRWAIPWFDDQPAHAGLL
ncbi:MAG: DUF1467 family protein [Hyphomicrobiales bacterium]|nr:DUF1467 family protein [Hyphomicrobiales bacterium]